MSYSVLVVDDSSFFRRHLADIINENPNLSVVGTASNGQEAVDQVESLRPDVVTMDYEMPMMNGVAAVREIMANNPTPILMLSSLTFEGARVTLDALDAGALDFLPKKFDEIAQHAAGIKNEIHSRILEIVKSPASSSPVISEGAATPSAVKSPAPASAQKVEKVDCDLVILGASTGGPVAVATILRKIPANYPLPILVVQHMPEMFTPEFAKRLDDQFPFKVKHVEEGDPLEGGTVYIAPGGMQLMFHKGCPLRLHLTKGDDRVSYKPCLDITFASAANMLGSRVLSVVLTGMGADGCDGARLLKEQGATVWTQDEESSLIYGMPMSVKKAGYSDCELALDNIASAILQATT